MKEIDFSRIRSWEGSQHGGFEELCCQLALHFEEVPSGAHYQRIHGLGGDGGVECYWTLENGSKWGWHAKYFLNQIHWVDLDKSAETALEKHPTLSRYYICLPTN